MCDKCSDKNQNIENVADISEEEIEKFLEANKEETEDVIYFAEPLLMNTENLVEDIEFDKEEFNNGIKSASFDCGVYTALVNAGMSNVDAINYIFSLKNIDMNIKLSEINAKANVEVAKNQQVIIEKQQV